MKRLLLLAVFIGCLGAVYGQGGMVKKVRQIPVDSTTVRSAGIMADAPLIDGSQNVQTRSSDGSDEEAGGYRSNPAGIVRLQLPATVDMENVPTASPVQDSPLHTGRQSVFIERERSQLRSAIVRSDKETAYAFFRETPALHITAPEVQIRIDTISTDDLGISHLRGTQLFRNVPVYGMDFTFHISAASERFMGYTLDSTRIDTLTARLSAQDAIRIAENDLSRTTTIQQPSEIMKELLNYTQPTVEPIYYPDSTGVYRFCYRVVIRPNLRDEWIYTVDGSSGEVMDKYNGTPYEAAKGTGRDLNNVSRTVDTWISNGTHYMINTTKPMPFNQADWTGVIRVNDTKGDKGFYSGATYQAATSASASWDNPVAISAMYHTSLVYDYLKKTFNRNSYDDKGSSMKMFVNVCDTTGVGLDNAYWNGTYATFGNGGTRFKNMAGGLDIVAHEFGHGIIRATANLEYKNQSGAINEAYADIFGAMVDRANWTIGEQVVKSYYRTGVMRNMSDPHNGGQKFGDPGWQPAHVSEMYLGTADYGGVHYNNSIPAHTFYVYATATSKERAEQVYYRALDKYLTPTSQFKDLRVAIINAAKDLNYANDVKTIESAFDKVGIMDETVNNKPPEPPKPNDLQPNSGQQGLLVASPYDNTSNTLYKITNSYKTIDPISKTALGSTPSITDDGKLFIFADSLGKIRKYDMVATTNQETYFCEACTMQSVAISRDGNRVAAIIAGSQNGTIWLWDRVKGGNWQGFKLYHPTTGEGGAKSGGVRYADAMEFDHTGEYLLYDAYSVNTKSVGGEEEEGYWDIGLIHVWNNSRNTWGSGEIVKLFNELEPGQHVLNPVFSKNSPHIIAFESVNEKDYKYHIYGANLATGDVNRIVRDNNTPSYPSYSMDDKHLAFNNIYDTRNEYVRVRYVNLASNKISVSNIYPADICQHCAYPVYYGTGTRVLGATPAADFSASARSGGRGMKVQFVDGSTGNPTSWRWTFQGGTPQTSTAQHPQVTYNTAGTFYVALTATNTYGSSAEVTKQGYIRVGTTGVEFIERPTVAVYPNPATDHVWLTGVEVRSVRLFDLMGKAYTASLTAEAGGKTRLDLSILRSGIYLLQITLADGTVQTEKIVKK
jgi:Zn-dependent metalloprotease/PKD repeat protein